MRRFTRRSAIAGFGAGAVLSGCAAPAAPWPSQQGSRGPRAPANPLITEAVASERIEEPGADLPGELREMLGIWQGMIGSSPAFSIALAVTRVTPQSARVVYAASGADPRRPPFVTGIDMERVSEREYTGGVVGIRVNIRGRSRDLLDIISGRADFTVWSAGVLARYRPPAV